MKRKSMSLDDYRASRMISSPIRMFDLCLESDGAGAILVTSSEKAADMRHKPVFVLAASQALHAEAMEVYTEPANSGGYRAKAKALYHQAGITAKDIDVAMLYDASTLMVLLQLEGYGFVEKNHAWRYLTETGIGLNSPLPVNTNGGHLSEGYIHGMNLITEAVRQLRGVAENQVANAQTALFGAAGASSLILAQ